MFFDGCDPQTENHCFITLSRLCSWCLRQISIDRFFHSEIIAVYLVPISRMQSFKKKKKHGLPKTPFIRCLERRLFRTLLNNEQLVVYFIFSYCFTVLFENNFEIKH